MILMNSLKPVVPPHPTSPSNSQHGQLPSDIGHVGHDQQINNQPHTYSGVLRRRASRPATPKVGKRAFLNTTSNAHMPPSKVDLDLRKQGPPRKARRSRELLHPPLKVVSHFVSVPQLDVAATAEDPEIGQLRRGITALQGLEEPSYSDRSEQSNSSYGSSTLVDPQDFFRNRIAGMSRSIVFLPEDSECMPATTNEVMKEELDAKVMSVAELLEAQSGYIDPARLPRKKETIELGVATLPPHVQLKREKLPRRKE